MERATYARFLGQWHGLIAARGGGGTESDRREGLERLEQALLQLEGLPIALSDLEGRLLPARVVGYGTRLLDELLVRGSWVWIGRGALGAKDGQVALYRRDRIELQLEAPARDPEQLPGTISDSARSVLVTLAQRGACFYTELRNAQRALSETELEEALWELVWGGLVTNDTLDPLRRRGARRGTSTRSRGRLRSRAVGASVGGRWSLVANLFFDQAGSTERLHGRALTLLERHGVLTREAVANEGVVGGFAALYPVLREMEEAGKVRRGYFVDGLGGAQFAFPGAVDRLRAARRPLEQPIVTALAIQDPAQPYGAALRWPESRLGAKGFRRAVGGLVVVANGELVLHCGVRGKHVITTEAVLDDTLGPPALEALRAALRGRGKAGRIERIDDVAVLESDLRERFVSAGFLLDYDTLYAAL
ncbi:MAG: hypothetical protein AAFZ65_15695 [Planctomycetota bacterium]